MPAHANRGRILAASTILALSASVALSACGAEPGGWPQPGENAIVGRLDIADLRIGGLGVRTMPEGGAAPLYGRISNVGESGDALEDVRTDAADSVQLINASGQPVDALPIPAHEVLSLGKDGAHVKLEDLQRGLPAGEPIHLTLVFRDAGSVRASVMTRVDVDGKLSPTPVPSS